MAHMLDFSKGFAAIAIASGTETPWHGYVNEYLEDSDTPEDAVRKSGLDYTVRKARVNYSVELDDGTQTTAEFENKAVLYRSDNGFPLSVMSESHYVPAQPIDLVRGLFEVTKGNGFKIDCIMSLKEGKVISALARREADPGTIGNDIILPYLALMTSYDGTFARSGLLTSIRHVCMNTASYSYNSHKETTAKQRNSREFTLEKANDLFDKLGEFDAAFAQYMDSLRAMAKVKMTDDKLKRFFAKLYAPEAFTDADNWKRSKYDFEELTSNKQNNLADLLNFFEDSPGSDLPSANGTLYGAYQTVTYYQDHEARTKGNKRWESATLGNGAKVKDDALALAMELVS